MFRCAAKCKQFGQDCFIRNICGKYGEVNAQLLLSRVYRSVGLKSVGGDNIRF